MNELSARILIVEDEPILAKELEIRLKKRGLTIVGLARNSASAIALAATEKPDLVMMDIHIEGLPDGIDTARMIWEQFGIGSVFLTGFGDEATIQRAKSAEPLGYILKPFGDRDLQTTVEMALVKSRLQQKLRENEAWLSVTLNSVAEALIATDAKGQIRLMNKPAETLTGWDAASVMGYDFDEVFRAVEEISGVAVPDPVNDVMKTRKQINLDRDVMLKSLTGHLTPVRFAAQPIKSDKGFLLGVVVTFSDMTHRRKLEDALRENELTFRQVIESSSDLLWQVDMEGRILFANPASQRLIGYNPDYLKGRDLFAFIHPDDRPALRMMLSQSYAKDGASKPLTIRFHHRNKSLVDLETIASANRWDEKHIGVILNARDISGQARADDILAKAEEKARQVNKFKAGFLASLSHEMRTPLTGILGIGSILEMDLHGEQLEMAQQIVISGKRLLATMESIVDLAKVESGEIVLQPERLELVGVLNEAVRTYAPLAAEKGLRLKVQVKQDPGNSFLDRRWVRQSLLHLIRFHMQHTMKGSVSATVSVDEEKGLAVVAITDTGIGFSDENMAKMLDSPEVDMGLTIAAGIIRHLGGDVSIVSRRGHGTTITVRFPMHKDAVAHDKRISYKAVDEAFKAIKDRPYILIVDDDADTRQTLSRLLNSFCDIRVASTLIQAFEIVPVEPIDLVLADIRMETEDAGFRLLERIHNLPKLQKPTVIAITAHAQSGDRDRFLNAGFDGYIAKPFDKEDLHHEIKKLLLKR